MQKIIWLPLSSALVLVLSGCANNGGARNDPLGTGPFDSQGNYHEEWANDPSKWSKPGKRSPQTSGEDLPLIAKNDQPPPNASPLAPGGGAYSKIPPKVDSAREPARHSGELKIVSVKPKSSGTKSHTKSATKSHVAETSTPKPKSHVTSTKTTKPKTHPTSDSDSSDSGSASSSKPKPHVTSSSSSKTKSSGTTSKTKSKSGNYTVKSGDSLERIARHSGTSVSAIKKANGMSDEMIHPGQTLVVPK